MRSSADTILRAKTDQKCLTESLAFTDQLWQLLIRGVIYKSAGVKYWSAEEKNKNGKNRPKKGPKPKTFFLYVYLHSTYVRCPNYLREKISTSQSLWIVNIPNYLLRFFNPFMGPHSKGHLLSRRRLINDWEIISAKPSKELNTN